MSKSRSENGRDKSGRDLSNRTRLTTPVPEQPPRQKLACIEWINESPDSIDFTHNVPLEWVRGYSPDEKDESYVVEWRQAPKPKGGWHFYDGIIHEVSEDEEFLKIVMINLKRTKAKAGQFKDIPKSAPHIDSPEFRQMLAAAVKDALNQTPQRSKETREAKEKEIVHSTQAEKVQVGKSLLLDKTSYNIARLASSPGRMVGICLRQAFSRRRLTKSSYAGQRRTKDGMSVTKPSLKKYQKTQDIHNFVLERFPHLTQSAFSSAVNSFLGEKANQIRQVSYVSESESEVDDDMD
ncbi:uncharacterized protein LOC113212540 [Frankliniella occidentalis]|uniref:Uncharacterized protein LOC113212540 n=1 Tax=Frankliniella occidentalis TaxID=133901 RepID=A0A6J1T5Y0_FRAOC|nr:uncharacterized protein LOC113212540 [Frankliniella occidentalis]